MRQKRCTQDQKKVKKVFCCVQELRNFRVTMSVEPRYHPNIIGKKGAKINKIRETHDVRIQLPERDGSGAADEITVMGYEHQVKAAEADILKIVHELVSYVLAILVFSDYM